MKFNRRAIMTAAWAKYRRTSLTFAQALRTAWAEARMAAARYNVYGERFGMEAPELIACGVTQERAGELKWWNKCRYDHITIKAA